MLSVDFYKAVLCGMTVKRSVTSVTPHSQESELAGVHPVGWNCTYFQSQLCVCLAWEETSACTSWYIQHLGRTSEPAAGGVFADPVKLVF